MLACHLQFHCAMVYVHFHIIAIPIAVIPIPTIPITSSPGSDDVESKYDGLGYDDPALGFRTLFMLFLGLGERPSKDQKSSTFPFFEGSSYDKCQMLSSSLKDMKFWYWWFFK